MEPVEILIYKDIVREDAADYVSQIKAAGAIPILLRLNSDGGSVFAGYAIYNALLAHKPGVTTQIDGVAASTASFVAMAGNPVRAAANSMLIIHNPSTDISGDAEDLRSQADGLDKIKASIISAYSKKTGLPTDQLSSMMDAETWLTAEEAKAYGFVDEIIPEVADVAMRFDTSRFRNPPQNLIKNMKRIVDIINKLTGLGVANLKPDAGEDEVHAALMNKLDDLAGYQDRLAAINKERDAHYSSINDLYDEFSRVAGAHQAAVGELTDLKKQFDAVTATATEAQNKLTAALADVTAKSAELTTVNNRLEVATGHMTRLESLCDLRGVDPKAAVPHVDAPGSNGDKTLPEWVAEMRAAATPEAKNAVRIACEKAITEKKIRKA